MHLLQHSVFVLQVPLIKQQPNFVVKNLKQERKRTVKKLSCYVNTCFLLILVLKVINLKCCVKITADGLVKCAGIHISEWRREVEH